MLPRKWLQNSPCAVLETNKERNLVDWNHFWSKSEFINNIFHVFVHLVSKAIHISVEWNVVPYCPLNYFTLRYCCVNKQMKKYVIPIFLPTLICFYWLIDTCETSSSWASVSIADTCQSVNILIPFMFY
ncbi:hypothetical protein CSKR_200003 [Clonorchis sinensis]|uniref:Uncharacterized protein n=1 Tax=Clonorchis sinensis TaxID=79923 RepID=A0A8T1M0V7_CLOSI|nr:hypothetical protein CSKR_200003 [Clonorchis sinensis]